MALLAKQVFFRIFFYRNRKNDAVIKKWKNGTILNLFYETKDNVLGIAKCMPSLKSIVFVVKI